MTEIRYEDWEPVIGLEIHVQFNTQSKMFSSAPNRFGDEPNTNITEVDTGQPGTLPVLNKEAVRKGIQFGCAIQARIARESRFDRKSYFYPDSPRNFQITQFEQPLVLGGTVTVDVDGHTRHFAVNRAHLEDDAGMLKHFSSFAGIDYNRAGVGLLEIVSEPCFHTPKEAVAYAVAVRAIMQYLDASDCNMEEGSLRIDANISVRPKGEKSLRPKIEIKNMNSFHNMELAIEAEILRQVRAYSIRPNDDPASVILKGTYRFDTEKKETVLMREKEEAHDYRYFPEPDLPPLILSEEEIETIRATLPELPHQRYRRYLETLQLPAAGASFLINDKALSDYFEVGLSHCDNPKSLCNWIIGEFLGRLKEKGQTLPTSGIESGHVGKLVSMIDKNIITGKIAKSVADDMVASPGKDPELIVKENPSYLPLQDVSALSPIVDKVLAENPDSIADFKKGNQRAFGFLVGQVMKMTNGQASPAIVNQLLKEKLK